MAKALRYLCTKKCWIKNTMFMPGNLVRRELIERVDEKGEVVINRHFAPIDDYSPEGIKDALDEAETAERVEAKKRKDAVIANAKKKAEEEKEKTEGGKKKKDA